MKSSQRFGAIIVQKIRLEVERQRNHVESYLVFLEEPWILVEFAIIVVVSVINRVESEIELVPGSQFL